MHHSNPDMHGHIHIILLIHVCIHASRLPRQGNNNFHPQMFCADISCSIIPHTTQGPYTGPWVPPPWSNFFLRVATNSRNSRIFREFENSRIFREFENCVFCETFNKNKVFENNSRIFENLCFPCVFDVFVFSIIFREFENLCFL